MDVLISSFFFSRSLYGSRWFGKRGAERLAEYEKRFEPDMVHYAFAFPGITCWLDHKRKDRLQLVWLKTTTANIAG